MSGSFVVAGAGLYQATRVGKDSFAAGLTEQAKKFHLTNSELRDAINGFIRAISFLLVPVGLLLLWSQLVRADLPVDEAIRGTIAGVVTMVPEGLVLLTSIAMAVSVIRLAQKRVLVQDMPAVEVLARVDTICVDKTGTLTEPGMRASRSVDPGRGTDMVGADDVLGALGGQRVEPQPDPGGHRRGVRPRAGRWSDTVPFSSARKWSPPTFDGPGRVACSAHPRSCRGGACRPRARRAPRSRADGARVLLLARRRTRRPSADGAPGGLDADRPRGDQPAASAGCRGDGRVLPRAGRQGQGHLR